MQHTSIRPSFWSTTALVSVALFALVHAVYAYEGPNESESVWPVARPTRMYIEGSIHVQTPSTGLDQSVSFTAVIRTDSVLFTATGPFGIVVARVYAQPDSFLVVNYLQQMAIDGDPRSSKVNDVLPIPLRLNDILSIVRCIPPGSPGQYVIEGQRDDGTALYRRSDSSMVEFALIDSIQHVLRQFQRKRVDGLSMLSIQYADVKQIDDELHVPHTIRVRVNDGEHTVTLEYDEVTTVLPKKAWSRLQVPRSYTRTSIR